MLKRNKWGLKGDLKSAFYTGYANAAASLRRLTKDKVYFNNFFGGFYQWDSKSIFENELFNRKGSNLLITTELFGDLTGKSYLLISDKEFDMLTQGIPDSKDAKVNLKEEFTKELDNILSASVITELSNELNLKIYGDIPMLIGKINDKIGDIIQRDFREHAEVYVTAIYFSFESKPSINPFFIWVVNSKALTVMEDSMV